MQVIEFLLLDIPAAINQFALDQGVEPIFKDISDLHEAVNYFGVKSMGKDFIEFLSYHLDNIEMSISINDKYSEEPIIMQDIERSITIEPVMDRKIFDDTFSYFFDIITVVVAKVLPKLKVIHFNTEYACNSPPIREPCIRLVA